ncbi:MAG: HD domain-containing phosphohydrolase [Candidatus Hydromicrobium sp.]
MQGGEGDEFSILLPKTTERDSEEIVNRIRTACLKTNDQKIPLSISLGTSTKINDDCDIGTIVKEAEDRMYRRKLLEIKSISSSIISSLERTLQEKSYETEEHAVRMKEMALILGHSLKLSENKLNELSLLSTLHDIGKIAIPDEILMKPGKLTEKEWDIVKRHPEVGYNISGSSPQLEPIADAVLSHHEWWDGSGYPQGLKGENIPLISRIISIIDAYDVMTHDRSYKKAVSKKESLEELKRCAGTQFDPKLVKIFIQVLS